MMTGMAGGSTARITSRGALRRDQILATATDMFLALGYEGVSVDEIIRTVGGSKTNLYRHFGSKEGVFEAVVVQACDSFIGGFTATPVAHLPPAEGLRLLGRALLRILLEERHVAFQRLVLAESGRFPAMARLWFESGPHRSRRAIAAFLRAKQAEGALPSRDCEPVAVLYHDMIVTNPLYLALLGVSPSWPEIERSIDRAVETLLRGIERP